MMGLARTAQRKGLDMPRRSFAIVVPQLWARCRARLSVVNLVAVVSVAVLVAEFVHPAAYEAPSLRTATETVMTLFALAGAWLLRRQFIHSRRLRDLLLFGALLTLGLMCFCSYALPAALDVRSRGGFAATALWGELFVALMFVAAARAPADRSLADPRRSLAMTAALSAGLVTLAALFALPLRDQLVPGASHPAVGVSVALQHPLALILALAATELFACAAIGFARRDRIESNEVASPLAGAALLLAVASLSQLAVPEVAPNQIALGEGLRLVAWALLLLAAARRELKLQTVLAHEASIAERRRVARDLHDGLAQDLAFIAAHGERIAEEMGAEHPVVIAARRALDISRSTIAELSDLPGATARDALRAVARELSHRFEIAITVDVEPNLELAPDVREHMSRIAREAIANAARHGGAKNVLVSLERCQGAVTLRVRDDGCGIDEAHWDDGSAREGFGLRSMRERAVAVGGQLSVRQPGTAGTELEVVLN